MNILVTGGVGFIGSHFVEMLINRYPNANIVILDCLNYSTSRKHLDIFNDYASVKFIEGSICSADLVRHILSSEFIDTIVHFAAESHVDHSFGNSLVFTQNNVVGTHVLLEAARERGIDKFIHISTDEVYGEIKDNAATEQSLLLPTNPYAATKAAAEMLVQAYHKSYGLNTIITRSNNIYGPRQYPEKVIPKFICSILKEKPLFIHGEGFQTRHFLYVEDVVDALDLILQKGVGGEIYNINSNDEYSVTDLAKLIYKYIAPEKAPQITFSADRDFNDSRYLISGDKLLALGWKATTPFQEGLAKTITWYRKNINNWGVLDHVLVPHSNRSQL